MLRPLLGPAERQGRRLFFASRRWSLCVPEVPREDSCRRNRGIGMTFINKMWDRDISEMEYIKWHFGNRAENFLHYRSELSENESISGGIEIRDGDDIWWLRLVLKKKKRRVRSG